MTKGINNKDWKLVSFSEMCKNLNESEKDPLINGIERYVGLEHIESGNLHIKSWGKVADGTTFTKRFRKGNVLFGKRRAYLRKAALADFDGICSGDILVFESNEKVINPNLLPFIVSSDKFFDYAIQTSAGSLSPRTKFQDLAKLKFLLPPKDQQSKLAELLWTADSVVQKNQSLLSSILINKDTILKDFFSNKTKDNSTLKSSALGFIPKSWKLVSLQQLLDNGKIVSHLDGNHGGLYPQAKDFVESGVPYLSANCIVNGELDFSKAKFLSSSKAEEFKKGVAINNDVLLAHNATVGPAVLLKTQLDKVILSTTLTYYRANKEEYDNAFLLNYIKSEMFQSQLQKVMKQSTRNQVPITTQRKLLFLDIPLEDQISISNQIEKVDFLIKKIEKHVASSTLIQNKLINQIFSA